MFRFSTQTRVVLICAAAAWLTACGGGGGGGAPAAANPSPTSIPPVADAGLDQTVMRGLPVILDGSDSSASDGSIATFAWTQNTGPMVNLIDAVQPQASFNAPEVTVSTVLEFELTVTDDAGLSGSDSVRVTVAPQTFSISGSASVAPSIAVDSDVNDPDAGFEANDTPETAQSIPNPVTLGGYVNELGAGETGRSQGDGDTSDFFRVGLVAGETITLLVAESFAGDVDLWLYDAAGGLIDASLNLGAVESLSIPSTGEFLVEARAFSGASNYLLVIGQVQPVSATGGFRLSDDFIPGEVILRYRDGSMAPAGQAERSRVESVHRLSRRAGAANRAMLMGLGQRRRSRLPSPSGEAVAEIDRYAALPSAEYRQKYETLLALKELNRDSTVAYAEPNYVRRPMFQPNDEHYLTFQEWHYGMINLPAAWDITVGDPNVTVAVIDTGVLVNHPDLQGQLLPGYDFIRDPNRSLDGDGIDPNPDDPGDGGGIFNSSFHGTHVAGTVAAATNNSIGVAGVAGDARILPLRVCGFLGCSSFDIIQAVRYAAGLPNSSGTMATPRVDVMNLSLGGGAPSGGEQDAFDAARAAGVVVVAAAGNDSTSTPSFPAAYQNVISVNAVGRNKSLASYSNTGSTVDVAAPGGDFPDLVRSTGGDDSLGLIQFVYPDFQGTSMASPHVAGVVALMKSLNAALTPGDIDAILAAGDMTEDLGPAGRDDTFGHGLIDAQKAVAAAMSVPGMPPPPNPTLGVTPSALNFGITMPVLEMTARNVRTGSLQVTGFSIPPSAGWLMDPVPFQVDADGLGVYTVSVNRGGLSDGIYSTTITANSVPNVPNDGVLIPVIMQVSSIPLASDAGFVYVLLVDQQTGSPVGRCDNNFLVGQCNVNVGDGQYAFTFINVPPGEYRIIAGTDADNDFFICDSGEACGAFLTIAQPSSIPVVDTDLSGNDFPIGYTAVQGIGGQSQGLGASPKNPAGHRRSPLSPLNSAAR